MAVNLTYDRASFFANLRANGHSITPEQEEAWDKAFHNQSPNGDLFHMGVGAFEGAIAFLQDLLKMIGLDISLTEKFGTAMENGSQRADSSKIDRYCHILRNKALEVGIDPRTAAAMTGDTSTDVPIMPGNLNQILLAQTDITPENRQRTDLDPAKNGFDMAQVPQSPVRFAATSDPAVTAPNVPLVANPTPALTGRAPSA